MMDTKSKMSLPHAGLPIEEVDTPALVISMDALEHNLDCMARFCRQARVRLRPHAKTHKSLAIARMQIERGAEGIYVQKVSEAEVFANGGIEDILITNEIVSPAKISRMVRLVDTCRLTVCVDHPENVALLSQIASGSGLALEVLVEINVARWRCGIAPGRPAADLAMAVADSPGLKMRGIQAYNGAMQHLRSFKDRQSAAADTIAKVEATLEELDKHSLPCELITGAGSGTYQFEAGSGVYNEIQPGSYIFMDADYGQNLDAQGQRDSGFRQSLFVHAQVISLQNEGVVVVDAGVKSLSNDKSMPQLLNCDDGALLRMSDEHGIVDLSESGLQVALGDRLHFVPGHCDPTVNLHDHYVCERGGRIEAAWPVDARGAIF